MKEELKRIFKSKMLIATLVAVVILPLIYGGLYLWAFWDPYGKLDNLPIAIVNEDTCAYKSDKKDKKQYCFGQDLVDKLSDEKQMNWQFVDRKTAEDGLKNKKYYTLSVIPQNFSKNILSIDTDNPEQAKIEFQARQASSFMASKFSDTAFIKIKAALNEKISKEYFDNIFSETRDSVKDLQKAADGAGDLVNGLVKAKDGSKDLYDGIDKANSGAVDLKRGLVSLHEGGEKLANGVNDALTGTITLTNGAATLNNGLVNLSSGTSQLQIATDSLISGQTGVIGYINAYIMAHPEVSASAELQTALSYANAVSGGLAQMKTGIVSTNQGMTQLVTGSGALENGLQNLSVGVSNLATGSASLRDNLSSAVDGSQSLISGLEKLKDGEKDLGDGLIEATNGAAELRDKLSDSVAENIKKTNENKNAAQSEVMSKPVDIHDVSIDIVNNNGTGFAPYFIPLSLWVGGMAIFFLVDLEIKNKNKFKKFLPKLIISTMVSVIQVLVLDLVLTRFLGLKVNHWWGFLEFSLWLGICMMLIQLYLTLSLGLAGKFVGIVLLMLQLTSSAGSYPIETAPVFFQKIGPFLPMTYGVSAFRELISGDNMGIVWTDVRKILIFVLINLTVLVFDLLRKSKMIHFKKVWIKNTK